METKPHAWLIKSEPESYGIQHLKKDRKTPWTGVRNFQARNFMKDGMQMGDTILFYHSSCKIPGVYGLAKVASKPYSDPTQFDPTSNYYDPRATHLKPFWFLVDVAFAKEFAQPLTLTSIRTNPKLSTMTILQRGSRLSITDVSEKELQEVIVKADS